MCLYKSHLEFEGPALSPSPQKLFSSDLLQHRLWIGALLLHGPLAALLGQPAAPREALLLGGVHSVPKEAPLAPCSAPSLAGALELAQHR